MPAWIIPRSWTASIVTVAQMNEIRDELLHLYAERAGMFRGLHLRTHPDNDVAANKVQLLGLDDLIMDTGARYSGLTLPLSADITASGAAGLDTSTRVATAWYEVYLIGKASTNAIADLRLLLHRAKGYSLDQSNLTTDGTRVLRPAAAGSNVQLAQTLTPTNTGLCEAVDLKLVRTGSPTGNLWVTINSDASGVPGSVLATSQKINVANLPTAAAGIRFVFNTPATLTGSLVYWVILSADYTTSDTNNIAWSINSTSVYGGGGAFWGNGVSSWTGLTQDFYFRLYITTAVAAVTMPSGYDQKIKLGYVYNNGSNVLQPFIQRERRVVQLTTLASGSFSVTAPTLVDLAAMVPPCPVVAQMAAANDTNANYTIVGGVPDGFVLNGYRGGGGAVLAVGNTAIGVTAAIYVGNVPTQNQAVYAWVSATNGQVWVSSYDWLN